jgi:hypothetical protein
MTWYSSTWGDNHEDENVFAAGTLLPPIAGAERYVGPVTRSLHPIPVTEYRLDNNGVAELGIVKTHDSFDVLPGTEVDATFWMHDDCFFATLAPTDEVLERLMESVLAMHSYYLSQDVDWSDVVNVLVKCLGSSSRIRATSNQNARRFTVEREMTRRRWIFARKFFQQFAVYEVVHGRAVRQEHAS